MEKWTTFLTLRLRGDALTASLPRRVAEFCSVRYDQLLNASSVGPPPEVTPAGTKPTGNKGDLVTFTCPNGYNFHSRAGPHELALTCGGFKEGWQYPEDLDPELHGEPLQLCVW